MTSKVFLKLIAFITLFTIVSCQNDELDDITLETSSTTERTNRTDAIDFDIFKWKSWFDDATSSVRGKDFVQIWGEPHSTEINYISGRNSYSIVPIIKDKKVANLFVATNESRLHIINNTNVFYYSDLKDIKLSKYIKDIFKIAPSELSSFSLSSISKKMENDVIVTKEGAKITIKETVPYSLENDLDILSSIAPSSYISPITTEPCIEYLINDYLSLYVNWLNNHVGFELFYLQYNDLDGGWNIYTILDGNVEIPLDLYLTAKDCCFSRSFYCVSPEPKLLTKSFIDVLDAYPDTQIELAMILLIYELKLEDNPDIQTWLYGHPYLVMDIFEFIMSPSVNTTLDCNSEGLNSLSSFQEFLFLFGVAISAPDELEASEYEYELCDVMDVQDLVFCTEDINGIFDCVISGEGLTPIDFQNSSDYDKAVQILNAFAVVGEIYCQTYQYHNIPMETIFYNLPNGNTNFQTVVSVNGEPVSINFDIALIWDDDCFESAPSAVGAQSSAEFLDSNGNNYYADSYAYDFNRCNVTIDYMQITVPLGTQDVFDELFYYSCD